MALFTAGQFTSAAGLPLPWKVECDQLTTEDWDGIASIVGPALHFGSVEGVPRGGLPFANALAHYKNNDGPLLIVDDVLTTGASMERWRRGRSAIGIVLFARGECPDWVGCLWELAPWLR